MFELFFQGLIEMNWNCPKCKYRWNGFMDTFTAVLKHEKTHQKRMSSHE